MEQRQEIGEFKITLGIFVRIMLLRHFGRAWWAYAIPVVACAVMSFVDLRFLYVALMVVFILLPMALLFVYISHGLDLVNRYNIMSKTAVADERGITITMDEQYGMKNREVHFGWNEFRSRSVSAGCLIFNFATVRYRFFAIPFTAFVDEEQLSQFLTLWQDRLSPNGR